MPIQCRRRPAPGITPARPFGAEEGLIDPSRTVQIGFHGPVGTFEQDDWSKEHYTVITLDDVIEQGVEQVAGEVRRIVGSRLTYLSVDLDVLDIAYAPAVADPEVSGLTTREFFSLLNKFRGINLVGADIACFCPPLDSPGQITALTVSELLLHTVTHIADYRASHASSRSCDRKGGRPERGEHHRLLAASLRPRQWPPPYPAPR